MSRCINLLVASKLDCEGNGDMEMGVWERERESIPTCGRRTWKSFLDI